MDNEPLRIFRKTPFVWQSKYVTRFLRKKLKNVELSTALGIYMAISEIASDQGSEGTALAFIKDIQRYSGFGKNKVYGGLKSLQDLGVLVRKQNKTEEGKYDKAEYRLVEVAMPIQFADQKPTTENQHSVEKPTTEKPNTVNQTYIEDTKNIENNNLPTLLQEKDSKTDSGNNQALIDPLDPGYPEDRPLTEPELKNGIAKKIGIELLTLYNKLWQSDKRWTDTKEKHVKARLKEFSATELRKALTNASKNPWNHGKNDSGWTSSFEWLMDKTEKVERYKDYKPRPTEKKVEYTKFKPGRQF